MREDQGDKGNEQQYNNKHLACWCVCVCACMGVCLCGCECMEWRGGEVISPSFEVTGAWACGSLTKGQFMVTWPRPDFLSFIKKESLRPYLRRREDPCLINLKWELVPKQRGLIDKDSTTLVLETLGNISKPAVCDNSVLLRSLIQCS